VPTSLTFDEHLAALGASGSRLVATAVATGLEAPVPSCPAWNVRALLAHQTMVHRWAAATVRGTDPDEVPNQTTIRETVDDLPTYYRDGLAMIGMALRTAPDDLKAMTFLNDAPPPRQFWVRRQAHETTIHLIDAMSANLGRLPTAAEALVSSAVAVDGIDELVRGFFTRGRSKLWTGTDEVVVVAPTDAERRWVLRVGERLTVDEGNGPDGEIAGATTLSGTAVELYLGLWNRGDAIVASGDGTAVERWRSTQRVSWS